VEFGGGYFKLYLRFHLYSGMVRPTDEEGIAIEKIDCYSSPLQGAHHIVPPREAPGWPRAQGMKGDYGKK
jgi:hypothetical protein